MNCSSRCSPEKFKFAAKLRREMTPHERKVWRWLQDWYTGHYWRSQCVVYGYIVDFYCHALKMIIEVDGPSHFTPDGSRTDYDKKRTKDLLDSGFRVFQVPNKAVDKLCEFELQMMLWGCIRWREVEQSTRADWKHARKMVKRHEDKKHQA